MFYFCLLHSRNDSRGSSFYKQPLLLSYLPSPESPGFKTVDIRSLLFRIKRAFILHPPPPTTSLAFNQQKPSRVLFSLGQ